MKTTQQALTGTYKKDRAVVGEALDDLEERHARLRAWMRDIQAENKADARRHMADIEYVMTNQKVSDRKLKRLLILHEMYEEIAGMPDVEE